MGNGIVAARRPFGRIDGSVFYFVWGGDPGGETGPGFVAHELSAWELPLGLVPAELGVEEGIVEAGAGGVGSRATEVDRFKTCPVGRGQAHGAGLAAGIELAAGKRKRAERLAGSSDRIDLAVGGWIVGLGDRIRAFSDDSSIAYDDRGEGSAFAGNHILRGERDGAPKELWIW